MTKNVIPPDSYARMAKEFAKVKKMGVSQFIQWMASLFQSGHDDGWNACVDAILTAGEHFTVDGETEIEVMDSENLLTLDDVLDAMLSVKGIGVKRANDVIKILMDQKQVYN